ncbi:hypothetical protein ARMGADRAFT_95979 [Armillaria gallica]|uniref:Uncharacterized protein n=1 Tax=Armillaria gallica TaxID=47427 RepID=A0A2H3CXJ0_ARMGA|nr:hypothetical protein ARMGADRAFT_95979 [Armillaria gallica]
MSDKESFATYWSIALTGNTVCLLVLSPFWFYITPRWCCTCRGSRSGDYYWRIMRLVGLPYHLTPQRNLSSRTSGCFTFISQNLLKNFVRCPFRTTRNCSPRCQSGISCMPRRMRVCYSTSFGVMLLTPPVAPRYSL